MGTRSTRQPLRVLHLAGTANGAHWMYEQVRELRERGHDVTGVIAGASGTLAAHFERDGIPYHVLDLDVLSSRNLVGAASKLLALARLFRRLRPDVVHYHLFSSIILGRLAAWLADVPVRFSMIPGPYYLQAPLLSEIDARTAWLDTKVIASCELTRTLYTGFGVPREQVELIYYGQDARLFDPDGADGARVRRELGISPERPIVGDVAYFYPPQPASPFTPPYLVGRGVKGHDVLLRAVPEVIAAVPDALFLLVGEGWGPGGAAYQAQLEALAAELGVSHAVRFTGARRDIPDTLAAFDVSVQCSLNENLGGSIESLLMARPFIATAVGGLVDAVLHEETGLLVPPDDAPALARAIIRLLQDRPLAQRLARQGRARALELFTLSKAVEDLDALYARGAAAATATAATATAATVRAAAAATISGAGGSTATLPAALPRTRGYRLSRSLGRALYLSVWGWRLVQPMRRGVTMRGGARWRRAIAKTRLPYAWRVLRGDDLRVWGRPARREEPAGERRAPRIVQMAGIAENGDWLISICRELRAQGDDVAAIIGAPEGVVAARLHEAGVPFQSLSLSFAPQRGRTMRLLVYAVRLPWAVIRLARFFRRERVDIVHTHVFNTMIIGRLAAWLARVPYRVSMVPGPLHLEAPFTRWADRLTWWMDHTVIAGSRWTYERYQALGLHAPRLQCVSYGADAARFDPALADAARIRQSLRAAPDDPLIGLVAYFYPPRDDWQTPPALRGRGVKGHEDLIEAARIVREQWPRARVLLVGGGWGAAGERHLEQLKARCAADGLGDAILFLGRRNDVRDILAALDVAVQCSLSENYGGTIEALLMARPTVATRVGGMPEVIRHGETGLLVPPGDPPALAAAIIELLNDRPRARAMAEAGRQLALEKFQIAGTAAGIGALYDQRLARTARGARSAGW